MSADEVSQPPLTEKWTLNQYEDGPELLVTFENGCRGEIKPIEGETYYGLHVPIDELDEWDQGGQINEWSFVPFDRTREELREALENADTLGDLEDADNHVAAEFGRLFAMLERENL